MGMSLPWVALLFIEVKFTEHHSAHFKCPVPRQVAYSQCHTNTTSVCSQTFSAPRRKPHTQEACPRPRSPPSGPVGLPVLDISRVNKWSHAGCHLSVWLLSLTAFAGSRHVVACVTLHSSSLRSESQRCIHQLAGIWVTPTFWLL